MISTGGGGRGLLFGLIVNPIAGMGGKVGLKGTDGEALLVEARQRGARPEAQRRADEFLAKLYDASDRPEGASQALSWLVGEDEFGEQAVQQHTTRYEVIAMNARESGSAISQNLAQQMLEAGVDLIVFVGGDGTARDILVAIDTSIPALGIPAGVKMHSGVFALNPIVAAKLVEALLGGELVANVLREVRDYDEKYAGGSLKTRHYGELKVPEPGGFLAQTKVGGVESEPLAVQEICAEIQRQDESAGEFEQPCVIGAGSTCFAVKKMYFDRDTQQLANSDLSGLSNAAGPTLRGIDIRMPNGQWLFDVAESDLLNLAHAKLIVSFTGNQGFLFGRGNQALSATFLRRIQWPSDVLIIATRTKVLSLAGRPLLVDTGDSEFDSTLEGLLEIICGFEDELLYRVSVDYQGVD